MFAGAFQFPRSLGNIREVSQNFLTSGLVNWKGREMSVITRNAPELSRYSHFINGREMPSVDGEVIEVVCPSDGLPFATIARGRRHDVNLAVTAARNAFDSGPWSRISPTERGRILERMSGLIKRDAVKLAALESRDVGKILPSAVADITALARYFEYYAGAADKIGGEVIPLAKEFTAFAAREPLGVVAGILPWNSPTQLFGRVVSPALAMGNAVVLKPSEDACLTTLELAKLSVEAGLPEGVLNVVTGYGHEAGAALAQHSMIDFISFTGSPEVGTLVQQAAAVNHVAVTLELGGKSPQIVFDDANLRTALSVITSGIIINSGQTCSAGSRLLVQESILKSVTELFASHFRTLVVGAHNAECNLGPLINATQRDRVKGMIGRAIRDGIEILAEGMLAPETPDGGYYVVPTLLGAVPRENEIAKREIFGPVLSLLPFKDEEDAIVLANDTPYGLAAGIWTSDIGRALRVSKRVRSGQVYINTYGAGAGVELPFGGFKKSGHGREKGLEALLEFSATKTIVVNHGL